MESYSLMDWMKINDEKCHVISNHLQANANIVSATVYGQC